MPSFDITFDYNFIILSTWQYNYYGFTVVHQYRQKLLLEI